MLSCAHGAKKDTSFSSDQSKEDRQKATKVVLDAYVSAHQGVRKLGVGVPEPKLVSQTLPVYPDGFLQNPRHPAFVGVYVVVTESGAVADPIVVTSSDARLNPYVLNSVKSWRYEPVLVDGHPVSVFLLLPVATYMPNA